MLKKFFSWVASTFRQVKSMIGQQKEICDQQEESDPLERCGWELPL